MAPTSRPNRPEESLLDRVGAGDEHAFRELVERHRGRLLARAREVEPDLAEDVVQTALMSAYHQIRGGERPGALGAWLETIVHNVAVSELRRERETEPLGEMTSGSSTFDEVADRDRIRRAVAVAKDDLSPLERETLTGHVLEGRELKEIAADRGVSEEATRRAIYRARRRLRWAAPALVLTGSLEVLRRAAARVRDAGALGGTAAAGSAVAVAVTAAVAGGVLGGNGTEADDLAVASQGTGRPPPAAAPSLEGDDADARRKGDESANRRGKPSRDDPRAPRPRPSELPAPPSPATESPHQGSPPPDRSPPGAPSPAPDPTPVDPRPADPPPPPEPTPVEAGCPGLVGCLLEQVGELLNP